MDETTPLPSLPRLTGSVEQALADVAEYGVGRIEGVLQGSTLARVHDALRVGQVLTIGAPRNHFALDETAIAQGAPVVLVAGGIGITPHYAKLIPELPRLLHDFLKQRNGQSPEAQQQTQALLALLQAQQRTNRLLQGLIYAGLGFAVGLVVMQLIVRVRLF